MASTMSNVSAGSKEKEGDIHCLVITAAHYPWLRTTRYTITAYFGRPGRPIDRRGWYDAVALLDEKRLPTAVRPVSEERIIQSRPGEHSCQ